MIRKTALLGCATGHWVRTSGMVGLQLNARVHESARLRIESTDHDQAEPVVQTVRGPGVHKLINAVWSRVSIVEGSSDGAICLFEAP